MSDTNGFADLQELISKWPINIENINENTFIGTTALEKFLKEQKMQLLTEEEEIKLGNTKYKIYLADINENNLSNIGEQINKYKINFNDIKTFLDDKKELPVKTGAPSEEEIESNDDETSLGGGKTDKKVRKHRGVIQLGGKTDKKVRKHRGVIQLGGRAGKLRKGFKYTGNRTKTGLAKILKL